MKNILKKYNKFTETLDKKEVDDLEDNLIINIIIKLANETIKDEEFKTELEYLYYRYLNRFK